MDDLEGRDSVAELENSSVLGRLLEELSWEGSKVRQYRAGGRGFENVLTAEVLIALDFLPRTRFLGAIVRGAHGADHAREHVARELEAASITLLPEELVLNPRGRSRGDRRIVQPDAWISTPGTVTLVEAKRIRSSRFQPEQLAREYVALTRGAA